MNNPQQIERKHTADCIRSVRRGLKEGLPKDKLVADPRQEESANILFICMMLIGIILLLCSSKANASTVISSTVAYTEDKAVRCILGEARYDKRLQDSYIGMVAVGEFIRKNGVDRVKGCNATISEDDWRYMEIKGTIQKAWRAWYDSKYSNLIGSSTHFENVEDFGVPYWAKDMLQVAKVGSHIYYEEK